MTAKAYFEFDGALPSRSWDTLCLGPLNAVHPSFNEDYSSEMGKTQHRRRARSRSSGQDGRAVKTWKHNYTKDTVQGIDKQLRFPSIDTDVREAKKTRLIVGEPKVES